MSWVNEKEEWLIDWTDARCLKELSFNPGQGGALQLQGREDPLDVFFSGVIEAGDRCLVCRASGCIVDIFDISPTAEALVSWRVHLPSPVIQDVGISHVSDANEASLCLMFLTKAKVIHRIRVLLHHGRPDVVLDGCTACNLPSPPSSFCALDRDLAAIGCFDGSLHAFHLAGGSNEQSAARAPDFDFSDSQGVLGRIVGGFLQASTPPVLDMVSVGPSRGAFSSGFRLLSFSADGQLRLWEASERRAKLVATQRVLSAASEQTISMAGSSSTYMRVSPSRTRVCLVLRSTVYVVDLPAGLAGTASLVCKEVHSPFPGASPSLVSLSHGSLWSFWSNASREQLFHLDLEDRDTPSWKARALDAGLLSQAPADGSESGPYAAAVRFATEGCDGALAMGGTPTFGHSTIFTLEHQQEVWRMEEDGFDAQRIDDALRESLAKVASAGTPSEDVPTLEELVLRWWLGRIFLPGRYSSATVVAALQEASGRRTSSGTMFGERNVEGSLRDAVEDHLRRQAATHDGGCRMSDAVAAGSGLEAATALAAAASDFLRACDAAWRRRHQVCGMGVSALWAPHMWFPAANVTAGMGSEGLSGGCPLLLCHGGVSCIRAVHTWQERWWATLHLSRDLSNYERIEIENVFEMSKSDEWKLCGTAWLLSQAVSNANLGISLSLSQLSSAEPAQCMDSFLQDMPESLAAHVARCAQRLSQPAVAEVLLSVRKAVLLGCQRPEESAESLTVTVFGRHLQPLQGTWVEPAAPPAGGKLCLSDLLRGGVAASESAYSCVAMRDLLLLCLYAAGGGVPLVSPAWDGLQKSLEKQLPPLLCLQQAQGLETPTATCHGAGSALDCGAGDVAMLEDEDSLLQALPHGRVQLGLLPARPCDLWAARFRTSAPLGPAGASRCLGLRPPPASFQSLEYALELLRWQRWEALRSWCRHQPLKEVGAYMAGREWLAHHRYAQAREAFMHAEAQAELLLRALTKGSGLVPGSDSAAMPAVVAFREHVASLFRSCGQLQDEYFFLRRAAVLAEETGLASGGDAGMLALRESMSPVRQRLWSLVFERAVGLQSWEEAFETLQRIDAFESHLRLLSQRLRSCGRIELMLKLDEPHRTFFLSNLHEHASMGTPIAGSDALSCYQHLYALYFSDKDYLKASTVAYSLYSALSSSLRHFGASSSGLQLFAVPGSGRDSQRQGAGDLLKAGDCISKPGDVPAQKATASGGAAREESLPHEALSPYARALDHVWPLLEQQRAALLMLISALSLTAEQMILVPGAPLQFPSASSSSVAAGCVGDITGMRTWFAEASLAAQGMAISLKDARRLLLVVEAQIVLSGSDDAPAAAAETAEAVSSLGLVRLAAQVARTCSLDLWQCALRPFTRLCVEAETSSDEKVQALAAAALGPAQAYMFVRSDGAMPLGSGGNIRKAWWRTLEETLREATCRSGVSSTSSTDSLDASGVRLYSLVADEVLILQSGSQRLPGFLASALSSGPSWVTLLRLYMKQRRVEDAVELLGDVLHRCCARQLTAVHWHVWSPLHDFPVALVVQLLRGIQLGARKLPGGPSAQLAETLAAILKQFQALLEDFEKSAPAIQ